MTNLPSIMKDLHYFISCKEQVVKIELFHTEYDIAYQLSLFIQTKANTPFGLVAGSNLKTNLIMLFAQCQLERNIHITNKEQIIRDCVHYISVHVQHVNVINYLIFPNQARYEYPHFSPSYTKEHSPQYLIVNVSGSMQSIDNIDMLNLFKFIRESYKKTGRFIHDIQYIDNNIIALDFT